MPARPEVTPDKFVYRVRQYVLDKYKEGEAFETSEIFTIPSGSSVSILLDNPNGSKVDMVIIDIEITPTQTAHVYMYADPIVQTLGNELKAHTKKIGLNKAPSCKVYKDGTYTSGELIHKSIAYGGVKNFATGGQVMVGAGFIIMENHRVQVEVKNNQQSDLELSIRPIWYEEKVV